EHIRMARNSLKSNRIRTILTLLGIIIGVTSVTTIISLGEGVKQQVNQQIGDLGSDIITVVPGRNQTSGFDVLGGLLSNEATTATLSQKDLASVKATPNVSAAGGVMQLDGSVGYDNQKLNTKV